MPVSRRPAAPAPALFSRSTRSPIRPRAARSAGWRKVWGAALLGLALTAAPGTVLAAADSLASSSPPLSYWGVLPEPADSSAVGRFRRNRLPAWEAAVVYPWRVVTFPVKAATAGIGAGIVALDESGTIRKIGRILVPPPTIRGFTPTGSAGGPQGVGLGGALFDNAFFGEQNEARLRYEGTVNNAHKASLGVRLGKSGPRQTDFVVGYRLRPMARFYGLGPATVEADDSYYTLETGWLGTEFRRPLRGGWAGELEIIGSQSLAGGTGIELTEDHAYLADRFAGRLPHGYRATSRGVSFGIGLLNDNTLESGRPETGGVRRVKLTWFHGFEDIDTNFWTYHVEAQQFVPLWFSKRALALRGLVSYIDPIGTNSVPFQRLNYNDDPDLLRGYADFRFRDKGLALLNVEYRWPIWANRSAEGAGLDMYLLTDVGQVFGEAEELSLDNLTTSYGGGLRYLGGNGALGVRLEMARSEEGTQFRLRADQVFQFVRDGLFYGRNPIPSR